MPREGYWETAQPTADGLHIAAWAMDTENGSSPKYFVLTWVGEDFVWSPNQQRLDVVAARGRVDGVPGLNVVAKVNLDPHADWSDAALFAVFEDGSRLRLTPLSGADASFVADLNFTRFEVFENRFQNPVFRVESPLLQAYAAARALRIAEAKLEFWLAGAVVGIYRSILDNCFSEIVARDAMERWAQMQAPIRTVAAGSRLRWATSMHLASGYAWLAWGEQRCAQAEFAAIADYMPRLSTWPQALSTLGIGRVLAAWLTAKLDGPAAALPLLAGTEDAFQAGIAPLKIWNWHMYEEARAALGVWQHCFELKKALEGERAEHILPAAAGFRLSEVSAVMRLLVSLGMVTEERLPDSLRS